MTQPAVTEYRMPYLDGHTYIRVAGDLDSGCPPLVALHGGPGSTCTYLELLDPLAAEGKRAVITYDQLGCGRSPYPGHPELWHAQTWVDELVHVIDYLHLNRFHLHGQSWGGMLAITYLADVAPAAGSVASLILSSTLSSSKLWGAENHRMAAQLPADEWAAIQQAEKSNDFDNPAYTAAIEHYMNLHCADTHPVADAPEPLRRARSTGDECYEVAWGPNELMPRGTLANWDYTDRLHEFDLPALVISGTDDLCTPLIAKTMYDALPRARWELFAGCRHMCFADDTPRYLALLDSWMKEHDS